MMEVHLLKCRLLRVRVAMARGVELITRRVQAREMAEKILP